METMQETMELANANLNNAQALLQIIFCQMVVIKELRTEILSPPTKQVWENKTFFKLFDKKHKRRRK